MTICPMSAAFTPFINPSSSHLRKSSAMSDAKSLKNSQMTVSFSSSTPNPAAHDQEDLLRI